MQLKKLKIIFVFLCAALCSVLCTIVYYVLMTASGAKLLINNFIINKLHSPHTININHIAGNMIDGLILQDIIYSHTNPQNKLEIKLAIQNVNIKLNWLELIIKQNISINISKLLGTFNNESITASINFSKHGEYIKCNSKSFIKIGNNILNIEQSDHEHINFHLTANQLEILNKQASGTLIINGNLTNNLTKLNLTANITTKKLCINKINIGEFLENQNNYLILNITKDNNQTNSEIKVQLTDISPIMNFIPNITRLKGQLQGSIKFNNNLKNPKITSNLAFKEISMSLPEYGIKIKPLNIFFTAHNDKIILINGTGVMRNGPGKFELKGHIEPFSHNFSNVLAITGENIECINTPGYHLIASLNVKLIFLLQQNALQINGSTIISKGTIDLDKQTQSKIIQSKDIFFTNIEKSKQINYLKILPNIDLKIEPETKLLGKGLDTIISGKLKIYTANTNEALLSDGRITIKHGVYNLSGQEFLIEKGRIIYLPGTFITNPMLDIKILPPTTANNKTNEAYLYIEGTLENPIIRDSGLVNEHQAILQLLNFGNNTLTNAIKEKLHLQEFGIHEDDAISSQFKNKATEGSLLDNKNFVIGKKINNKMHLQYLKTLNTTNNTMRLKYQLNNNWSIGLESSTDDGHGADLRFSKEK